MEAGSSLMLILLILSTFCEYIRAAVIPPAWADVRYNPCAKNSWQYLYWKADGECYPIFKQGFPCPATLELVFDLITKEAKCQCPAGRLYWEEDGRCYEPYITGPCPEGSFLHPGQELHTRGLQRPDPHRRTLHQVQVWLAGKQQNEQSANLEPLGFVHCKQKGYCPALWGFWPATELCYPFNSQGPCQSGSLFRWNPISEQAECGCHSPSHSGDQSSPTSSWRPYYWHISATCHEHSTIGPCRFGEVFIFNQTAQSTQCHCSKHSINYHPDTGQCFEKYTRGPCNAGMWLVSHPQDLPQYSIPASPIPVYQQSASGRPKVPKGRSRQLGRRTRNGNPRRSAIANTPVKSLTCTCLPGFVYSKEEDQCFREYTQGPCRTGYFFIRAEEGTEDQGICWKNPCGRQELYLPESRKCFTIHSQGPCPDGQLVVADDQHGIGYRGHCGCSPANQQNYWPNDGKCYAHETRGPCRANLVFSVRSGDGLTPSCICPSGQIYVNSTKLCYKPYSQGPCAWNEWLTPAGDGINDIRSAQDSVRREGIQLDQPSYTCQCKPGYAYQSGSSFCQPPSLELLFSLPNPTSSTQRERRRTLHRRRE